MEKEKAIIAMSGGVDSSVAALLTLERGVDCIGVTMKLYENEDIGEDCQKSCCSLSDAEDARRVTQSLGMPFYVFDFTADFRGQVIDRFVNAYEQGITPNPCIDCNRYIKYERLYDRMTAMGFDYVVTGHYARIRKQGDRYLLMTGVDEGKDQSYVLYMLTQDQLRHTLFPVGDLHKDETRRLAEQHGFINARKRDSQDICFVPDGNYAAFIESYTGKTYPPGDFVGMDGQYIGRHRGVVRYTVGQRRGLGQAMGRRVYVTRIDASENRVFLGEEAELLTRTVKASDINLIAVDRIAGSLRLSARVRYSQKAVPATVVQTDANQIEAIFDQPLRRPAKGQALVLYDGEVVIGGGVII